MDLIAVCLYYRLHRIWHTTLQKIAVSKFSTQKPKKGTLFSRSSISESNTNFEVVCFSVICFASNLNFYLVSSFRLFAEWWIGENGDSKGGVRKTKRNPNHHRTARRTEKENESLKEEETTKKEQEEAKKTRSSSKTKYKEETRRSNKQEARIKKQKKRKVISTLQQLNMYFFKRTFCNFYTLCDYSIESVCFMHPFSLWLHRTACELPFSSLIHWDPEAF